MPESDEKHHFAVCLMNAFWKLHSCQPVNLVLSPLSSIGKVTKRECKICKGSNFKARALHVRRCCLHKFGKIISVFFKRILFCRIVIKGCFNFRIPKCGVDGDSSCWHRTCLCNSRSLQSWTCRQTVRENAAVRGMCDDNVRTVCNSSLKLIFYFIFSELLDLFPLGGFCSSTMIISSIFRVFVTRLRSFVLSHIK